MECIAFKLNHDSIQQVDVKNLSETTIGEISKLFMGEINRYEMEQFNEEFCLTKLNENVNILADTLGLQKNSVQQFLEKIENNSHIWSMDKSIDFSLALIGLIDKYCPHIDCIYVNNKRYDRNTWKILNNNEFEQKLLQLSYDQAPIETENQKITFGEMDIDLEENKIRYVKLFIDDRDEDQVENFTEGICMQREHGNSNELVERLGMQKYTVQRFYEEIENNENKFQDVLCMDFCGLDISLYLIRYINRYCPNIECLFINKTRYHRDAWISLITLFAPKLLHLSIDNSLEIISPNEEAIDLKELFEKCNSLEELKLIIFGNKSIDFSCLKCLQKHKKIVSIHIKYWSKSLKIFDPFKKLNNPLNDMAKQLSQVAESLKFLRLESDVNPVLTGEAIRNLELPNLITLNLPVGLFLEDDRSSVWWYERMRKWQNLNSLVLNFCEHGTDELLEYFSGAKFTAKMTRLRLVNPHIDKTGYMALSKYKSLRSLHLIDVTFESRKAMRGMCFTIGLMSNLEELIIEHSKQEYSLKFYFDFDCLFGNIESFCENLTFISLIGLPGINEEQLSMIRDFAQTKGIEYDISIDKKQNNKF